MPLTTSEVKQRLGYGAGKQIAAAVKRSEGHVSQVLSGLRPDRAIARHIARRLHVRLADLPASYLPSAPESDKQPEAYAGTGPRAAENAGSEDAA